MKEALIAPSEKVYKYDGTLLGDRIPMVEDQSRDVPPPLFWVPCQDNVVPDRFYYDPADGGIYPIPVKPPTNG